MFAIFSACRFRKAPGRLPPEGALKTDVSPAESGPFVETDLPAETDAPGESDGSPTETDVPGESDASRAETDAPGESDASRAETDVPGESDASPTETDVPADGSAGPVDGCGGGCAHTDAAVWTALLGLLLRRRARSGPAGSEGAR